MIYRIIVIYLIIILIYFKIYHIENNKFEKMLFSILVPFFGFAVVFFSEIITTSSKYSEKQKNKKNEIQRSKEFLTIIQSSLLDNLEIEDYDKAREIILSTKSLKLKEQCQICHIAINSKNVEISHIAAVSLMRIQNYFEKLFVHMESKTDLSKTENLKRYINGINKYLDCEIAYGTLKNKYMEKLIKFTEELINANEMCEEKYYYILINRCLELARYEKAKEYSMLLIEKHGIDSKKYELILKIAIKTKDKNTLDKTIEKIKTNTEISDKLVNVLKFWEGEN